MKVRLLLVLAQHRLELLLPGGVLHAVVIRGLALAELCTQRLVFLFSKADRLV